MKLKSIALTGLLCATTLISTQAQSNTPHQHTAQCAVSHEDGTLIKERMLRNRAAISPEVLAQFKSSRAITYIPVAFTIVGNASGEGYVSVPNVLAMLCDLNADYADQEVQFYIKDQIYYLNNTNIYNDAFSSGATFAMITNKKLNALNIYMSPTVNNQVASFYDPNGDYVFLINSEVNGVSNTCTHEVGHFFSLPHTFYGWENTIYNDGQAPNTATFGSVERVVRSGANSNCTFAADGFCDTPADYISYRAACPYTGGGTDPLGVAIDPDESNYMSYYADACVTNFSDEQKDAMASDIFSRGWGFLSLSNTAAVDGNNANLTYPTNNESVALDNNISLEWDAVANAEGYYVVVNQTFFGSIIAEVASGIVYNSTSFEVDKSLFEANREYTWYIQPFSLYSTCGANSGNATFTTTEPSSILKATNSPYSLEWVASDDANTVQLLITANTNTTATLEMYSLNGQQILTKTNRNIQQGSNMEYIDVSMLAQGTYVIALHTDKGTLIQQIIK